jgi:hypothetical protein
VALESFWLVTNSQFAGNLIEDATAVGMYGANHSFIGEGFAEEGEAEGISNGSTVVGVVFEIPWQEVRKIIKRKNAAR